MNVSNVYHDDILLFCNAQSIRNTCLTFKTIADKYNARVLAIVETWLCDDINGHYVHRDYQQFVVSRNSVASEPPGRGVMLLLNPHYFVSHKTVSVQPPYICNAVAVIFSHDGHCWVFVYLLYRVSEDVGQLCRYLNCILSEHRSVTIIGDLIWQILNGRHLPKPAAWCDLAKVLLILFIVGLAGDSSKTYVLAKSLRYYFNNSSGAIWRSLC